MRLITILQAGTSLGSFSQGVEDGPKAMLAEGLVEALEGAGYEVYVAPPIQAPIIEHKRRDVREFGRLVPWLQALRQQASKSAASGRVLTLGGDHSIALASLLATKQQHPRAVCIYIDAHPDCNTPETSPTANLHGMPLTVATGEWLTEYFPGPYWQPAEICMIGIKDIDPAESAWLQRHGVLHFTMDDVIEQGIGTVMARVRSWINGRPVHVSYDIDGIDGEYAPGTGIVNSGGLTRREATYLARQFGKMHPVAVDLVEVNPHRDQASMTVRLGVELAVQLMGGSCSAYDTYLKKSADHDQERL